MAGPSDGIKEVVSEVISIGASTQNATSSFGGSLEQTVDHALWIGSRIAALIVLVLALGAVVVWCIFTRSQRSAARTSKAEPFRPLSQVVVQGEVLLVQLVLLRLLLPLCTCSCLSRFSEASGTEDAEGYVAARRGSEAAQQLFLGGGDGAGRGLAQDFEVQHEVVGGCDLACETLDLDWYGDEEGVIINVVQYSGSQVSKDRPLGEVQLSHDMVVHYAAEAAGNNDLSKGSRLFPVKPLGCDSERVRSGRFSGPKQPALLQPFMPSIIAMLQDPAVSAETTQLRDEVKRLRAENEALGGKSHRSAKTALRADDSEVVMRVAIRFTIVATTRAGTQLYKRPSFEEQMPLVAEHSTYCA
eukprot:CAMPEP_0115544730 /NCGR_PEP_ID=MMETSP0271-20121206/92239_1 /TAXON_ID=71861 /ORGANISM="Scrippsiella trochoidea, Strain CCMP3099" /LENGTH=357 /DNA_ID=CAMNT_0002978055 /DNA_START=13 /DNA_END=1087 /DNA_ORIENTATION=-